jgi:hypothetical protein
MVAISRGITLILLKISGKVNFDRCAVLQRLEIASVVCFQGVTAISNHFGVSIRNLGFLVAPGGVFVVRGGGCHSHFPASGYQRLSLGRIALAAELRRDAGLRLAGCPKYL